MRQQPRQGQVNPAPQRQGQVNPAPEQRQGQVDPVPEQRQGRIDPAGRPPDIMGEPQRTRSGRGVKKPKRLIEQD